MPKRSGLALAADVRKAEGGGRHGVSIVAMTASVGYDDVNAQRNAGFDIHLSKPFVLQDLRVALVAAKSLQFKRRWSGGERAAWMTGVAQYARARSLGDVTTTAVELVEEKQAEWNSTLALTLSDLTDDVR